MNKKIMVIAFVLFAAIAYSSIDVTQPWHPMQQILRSESYSIDNDNNGIVDTSDFSLTTYTIYPDITADNICTNERDTCDSRYYLIGETVANALKLDGRKTTDFCSADKSNCLDAYQQCDNINRICDTLYVDNSIIFESTNPLINCHSIMEVNNLTISKDINASILVVNGNLHADNIIIEPVADTTELTKYFEGISSEITDILHTQLYKEFSFDHESAFYHNGHYVTYNYYSFGNPSCTGYGASGKFVKINGTTTANVKTCIINANATGKQIEFTIYGKIDELQSCPDGWMQKDEVFSPYQESKDIYNRGTYKPIYARRCIKYVI